MKAAVNGVLNLSVLDGWWAEALRAGRRLGDRRASPTRPTREQLYRLLEDEVVPTFATTAPAGSR